MAFDTEYPKRGNVVDIKRSRDLILSCTAKLASETVALTRLAPLSFPVWAIIRLIATLPIRMGFTRDIFGLPQAVTLFAAKYSTILPMAINAECLATLTANYFNIKEWGGLIPRPEEK